MFFDYVLIKQTTRAMCPMLSVSCCICYTCNSNLHI